MLNGENERANWSAKNDIFERNFDAKIMITFFDQKVYELSLLNIIKAGQSKSSEYPWAMVVVKSLGCSRLLRQSEFESR